MPVRHFRGHLFRVSCPIHFIPAVRRIIPFLQFINLFQTSPGASFFRGPEKCLKTGRSYVLWTKKTGPGRGTAGTSDRSLSAMAFRGKQISSCFRGPFHVPGRRIFPESLGKNGLSGRDAGFPPGVLQRQSPQSPRQEGPGGGLLSLPEEI